MPASTLESSVTTEVINPIISATYRIFESMLGCKPQRTGLHLLQNWSVKYELRAVISLSGNIVGTVIFSLPKDTACQIYHLLTEDNSDHINEQVRDAVGEVCNMIGGAAKAQLEKYQLKLGIPSVIHGDDVVIDYPTYIPQPMCITFTSEIGDFSIEAGFVQGHNH